MPLRLLLLDNLDSYTYNLAHLFALANGSSPLVLPASSYPNLASLHVAHGAFDAIIISPGPGTPVNTTDLPPLALEALASPMPVLGVCLGHQGLCLLAGASIERATPPVHGRTALLAPGEDCPLFRGLWDGGDFPVVRYHSLHVPAASLPELIVPTAWTKDGQVLMAVRHRQRNAFGVQFHPESVLTAHGSALARNFLDVACAARGAVPRLMTIEAEVEVDAGVEVEAVAEAELLGKALPQGAAGLAARARQVVGVEAGSADVFEELIAGEVAFWLDSASEAGISLSRCSSTGSSVSEAEGPVMRGRFSFMGGIDGPRSEVVKYVLGEGVEVTAGGERLVVEGSIFDYLEAEMERRKVAPVQGLPVGMCGGYVGYCGYEVKADVYGVEENAHESAMPDAWFVFADRVLVFDHLDGSVWMVGVVEAGVHEEEKGLEAWFQATEKALLAVVPSVPQPPSGRMAATAAVRQGALRFSLERSGEEYQRDVSRCLELIAAGESYEICLTNRLRTDLPEAVDVLTIYQTLRLVNPAPYAAFLRLGKDTAICCSSPERFLSMSSDGMVESKPIKGTRPRGSSVAEDKALAEDLRICEKDRSENLMIVDLVRNDLSRTCTVGSVTVPVLMEVETYASVHQLVSTVRGWRRPGISPVRVVRDAYPMGSMTGAPKVRTMSLIDELESSPRGVYSGTIGYLSLCGATDLNVVIRTAVVRGQSVEIGAGGAVVALSEPEEEFEEILVKGRPIMQAIALAATGSNDYVIVNGKGHRNFEIK